MKLVQQINDYTCGHACISMVTGVDINTLHEQIPNALDDDSLIKLLVQNGVFPQYTQYPHMFPMRGLYMMTVPSLNLLAHNHCVIVNVGDVYKVYDPNTGREGKKFYSEEYLHNGYHVEGKESVFSYTNVCYMNKDVLI